MAPKQGLLRWPWYAANRCRLSRKIRSAINELGPRGSCRLYLALIIFDFAKFQDHFVLKSHPCRSLKLTRHNSKIKTSK